MKSENNKGTYCLACDTTFPIGAKFCPNCGQNRKASILSVKELWANFLSTIFNVDNSFFRTLRLIGRPDKLTQMYVAGNRKQYINPIRMFLIMLVFLVAAFLFSVKNFGSNDFVNQVHRDYYQSLLFERADNIISSYDIQDSTRTILEDFNQEVFRYNKCPDVDTLYGGFVLADLGKVQKFLKKDFIKLTHEEIFEKYKIENTWDKMQIRQYIRLNKNPVASIKYLFGNGGWGIVPSILLICLVLKLFYRNHHIKYLEHLILVCNIHCFLFFIGILLCLTSSIIPEKYIGSLIGYTFILTVLMIFFAFKKYYREGFFRTAIKFGFIAFAYFFSTVIFIAFTMVISGFIYK